MTSIFSHASPIGPLTLVSDGAALIGVHFEDGKYGAPPTANGRADAVIDETRRQLDAYFAGRRKTFDVPLAPKGTPFQMRVWARLRRIPYGETWSYGALAAAIEAPKAVRAVGAANGRNPIPVIIPCHRVIGANGTLTGFGGGLDRKERLLVLEGWPGAARLDFSRV
jgi:methylated-DNA-[protein]-cysteine S-methyltransferase